MSKTITKVPATLRRAKPPHQVELKAEAGQPAAADFHKLYSIRQAAEITGLHYWLLLRAVNRGDLPSYQFGNARKRVRLPDIEGAIAVAGFGGRA